MFIYGLLVTIFLLSMAVSIIKNENNGTFEKFYGTVVMAAIIGFTASATILLK